MKKIKLFDDDKNEVEVDLKNLFVSREERLSKDLAQTLLSHNPDSYKLTKRRKNNVVKLYDF